LLLRVRGAPIGRRERDSPEIGLGRIELDRYVETVGHSSGGAYDLAGNPFFGVAMLEYQARVEREALLHNHERALRIHTQGRRVKCGRCTLERYVYLGGNTKQHALGAPPVLTRGSLLLYGRRWQGPSLSSSCSGRRGGTIFLRTGHGRHRPNSKVPTVSSIPRNPDRVPVNSARNCFLPFVPFEALGRLFGRDVLEPEFRDFRVALVPRDQTLRDDAGDSRVAITAGFAAAHEHGPDAREASRSSRRSQAYLLILTVPAVVFDGRPRTSFLARSFAFILSVRRSQVLPIHSAGDRPGFPRRNQRRERSYPFHSALLTPGGVRRSSSKSQAIGLDRPSGPRGATRGWPATKIVQAVKVKLLVDDRFHGVAAKLVAHHR
jgi:hypothetical protein